MKTAEQWTALYEDGGSELNCPAQQRITDIFREVQQDALQDAVALLRRVDEQELAHHMSGTVWCKLMADPQERCTCGQWELTADIEKFIEAQP